jgi:predicted transcriptional regulator of viral defense system
VANTILSRTDAELIGKTIETYGKVVKTEELLTIFKTKYNEPSARNRIQILYKNGWFIRIKQGLYLINDSITGQFYGDLPFLVISQCLFEESYVSLAYALHHYKLVEKLPETIFSISDQLSKKFSYQPYTFKIAKVNPEIYFGYHSISLQKRTIQIADPEKALLDYLYVDLNFTTPKVFYQPIKEHPEAINFEKLQQYALRFSSNVRRKTGFLLDSLHVDTKQLHASLKGTHGHAKMTKDSTQFNTKWRVYYDTNHLQ